MATAQKRNPKEIRNVMGELESKFKLSKEMKEDVLIVLSHPAFGYLVEKELQRLLSAPLSYSRFISETSWQAIIWHVRGLKNLIDKSSQSGSHGDNRQLILEMLRLHQVVTEVTTTESRHHLDTLIQDYNRSQRENQTLPPEQNSSVGVKKPQIRQELEGSQDRVTPENRPQEVSEEVRIVEGLAKKVPSVLKSEANKTDLQKILESSSEIKQAFQDLVTAFETNPQSINQEIITTLIKYTQHAPEYPYRVEDTLRIARAVTQVEPLSQKLRDLLVEFYGRKNKGTVKETYKRIWEIVYGKRRIREDFMDEEKKLFQDLGDHPSLRQLETLIEQVKNQPTEEQRIVRIFLKRLIFLFHQRRQKQLCLKLLRKLLFKG